jgi:hypothetical protein
VRSLAPIIAGVAVGLAWLTLWVFLLRAFGLDQKGEDSASRQKRLKQLGKGRYIALFGLLGPGLAFGLAMTTADVVRRGSSSWSYELLRLVFLSFFFGVFQGWWNWRRFFRDTVPFPPDYASLK